MDKVPIHRFNIWNLADRDGSEPITAYGDIGSKINSTDHKSSGTNRPSESFKKAGGRDAFPDAADDLDVLQTIYNYGPSIAVELAGTCTLPNGRSIACRTTKISSGTASLIYDSAARSDPAMRCDDISIGSRMNLDLEDVGHIGGVLSAMDAEGFQLAIDHEHKSALQGKLQRIASNRGIRIDVDERAVKPRTMRIEPNKKSCTFIDQAGILRKAKIVNVSPVDALIKAAVIPPVGALVTLSGKMRRNAKVVRTFEIGFEIKFCSPIPPGEFSIDIEFCNE